MYLWQHLMRFRWYFSVFGTAEGLPCASILFAEQRALHFKGSFLFFLRWPKPFAFQAHGSEDQLCMKQAWTTWLLPLKLFLNNPLKGTVQSHPSPSAYFFSQPCSRLNRNIHAVNSPITRSPHIIHKSLQCSPTSTWKFTLKWLLQIFLAKQCCLQHSNNMTANTSALSTQDLLLSEVWVTQKEKGNRKEKGYKSCRR